MDANELKTALLNLESRLTEIKDNVLFIESKNKRFKEIENDLSKDCLLYTSPSPRDKRQSRMPSSA